MSDKVYAIVRVGTVLGEGMSEKTAASIFIRRGAKGQSLTPFKHDMYRPMLYVDINDVCRICEIYVSRILEGKLDDLPKVVNVFWPQPITIIDMAGEVRDSVVKLSNGTIKPEIEVIDNGVSDSHMQDAKKLIRADVTKALALLGSRGLTRPSESIDRIVATYLQKRPTG
jgi:UDP-glucose 4-epimerase